ncbi:MAG: GGDEF domain-containing protein [Myxococcales bacterium]|nr:GGDEF domain-containing protein [Myxococcales bacterium]MCB9576093.1 GGDEF domain-containing protein [Polyangiaceae bacterium]
MPDDLFETTVEVTVTRDFTRSWRRSVPGQAFLVVIAGPRLGHRVILGEQTIDIGRGSACGLQLDADSVSRLHARITWDGHHHHAVDLRSTNGTYVNEARITDHVLSDGDRLQIGKVLLKYISSANVESAYHEEIQRLMRYDGLTGINNKSHFDETFHNVVWRARMDPKPLSLIVFDLDHFKNINDTHGHTAGDAVLRQVAGVVAQQVPQHFLLARVGGEEFAILCPGAQLEAARQLAERVRAAVEGTRFEFDGTHIPVTVSLGVAERLTTDTAPETLYERADAQLYAAKGGGRNRVC